MDTILNFIINKFPQYGGTIIVVLVVVFIVYKFTKFYVETQKTNCELPEIRIILKRIETSFTTLHQVLLEKSVISQSCFSVGNSPRQLNPVGEKLYKDSGAETLFGIVKTELIASVENKKFDSLLEMERECLNVVLEKMNDTRFRDIQNFAFQHPNFENNPLTYTDILFIISLKLRDEYLDKYPENKLGQVL